MGKSMGKSMGKYRGNRAVKVNNKSGGRNGGRSRGRIRVVKRPMEEAMLQEELRQEELRREGLRREGNEVVFDKDLENSVAMEIEMQLKARQSALESIDIGWLVGRIVYYCEKQADMTLHPYQRDLAERVVESLILNDGEEITALFSRQCIAEGSVIHTRDGELVRIEEHPNAWKTQENAEILEIRVRGGHIIRCTKNHPIMTEHGWIPAGLLKTGDRVCILEEWNKFGNGIVKGRFTKYVNIHSNKIIENEYEINEEIAELVGWLTADGSLKKGQSFKFTNTNMNYLKRVEELVHKYFPDVTCKWYEKGKGYDLILSSKGRGRFNTLKDFITIMDYDFGFPRGVNKFTKEQVCSFFRGMFASDGYVHTKKNGKDIEIGLACGNERVYAEYCRELLNKLGIRGQIKKEMIKRPFFRIVISGQRNLIKFKETIGYIPGKELPNIEKNYTGVNKREVYTEVDGEVMGYERVVSIRDGGKADVWDVEYPNKGWFLCGGIKVHNSGKSETVAIIVAGIIVILPKLAKIPMFEPLLGQFKGGIWVGLFAPSREQAFTLFSRIRSRLRSENASMILNDPEISTEIDKIANPIVLSNGSIVMMQSAAKQSQIESKTYHLIVVDECLPAGSKITTPEGLKNIEDIKIGEKVLTFNHSTQTIESKTVKRSFSQPIYHRKMVKVHLENGNILRCTDNHKVYTLEHNYIRADALQEGLTILYYPWVGQAGTFGGGDSIEYGECGTGYSRVATGGFLSGLSGQEVFQVPQAHVRSFGETEGVCVGEVRENKDTLFAGTDGREKQGLWVGNLSGCNDVPSYYEELPRPLLQKRKKDSYKGMAEQTEPGGVGLLVSGRRFHSSKEQGDDYFNTRLFQGGESANCGLAEGEIWDTGDNHEGQEMRKILSKISCGGQEQVSQTDSKICSEEHDVQDCDNGYSCEMRGLREGICTLPQTRNNLLSRMQERSEENLRCTAGKTYHQQRKSQKMAGNTGEQGAGYRKLKITKVEIEEPTDIVVYDLTVEDNHNFFAEGILIHNCQDCDRMKIQKCLTGDTKILTNKGYKRIDKIVRDKMGGIIRFDSNFNKLIEDDPIEFYDNGIQEVFNIRLNNGNEIKATKNHHFFGYRRNWKKPRWVTVEEIIKYQNTRHKIRLAVPDSLPEIKEGTEKDYYEGLLVGYFLGDGCITGSPMFAGNEETVKRLHKIINNLFGDNIKMAIRDINEKNGLWQVAYTTEGNKKNSNPITAFFREIGIYGMKGEKKHLPNHMSYSKEFYRGFIEALIETDGSVDTITIKPNISFANISETLVNEIKDILLLFGIHATKFIKYNNPIKGYSIKPLHILHIKSVLDIQRFYKNFKLFSKQNKLDISMETIKNKKSKNKCQFYPDTLRFYQVTNVSPAGKERTYCLKMRDRNFIANNIVSSNSIHPMMAATNGTIVKLGTPNTKKCEFLDAINRNKRMDAKRARGAKKNHYEFNYKVCQRYNPRYKKFIDKEKRRYGEHSDSFRMSYKLEWLLERGMFLTPEMREMMENSKLEHILKSAEYCAAGIDVGKAKDSTVVTILGVDWDKVSEDAITGELRPYKEVRHWLELHGDDYESQYYHVIEFLKNYNIRCIFIDATGVGTPIADRLVYGMEGVAEVIPYKFTRTSKSDMWKALRTEIECGRLRTPAHRNTKRLRPYNRFWQQMEDLEKDWQGQYMVCHHPKDDKDAHDDYPVSLALAVLAADYDAMPEIVEESNFIFDGRRRVRR